MSNKRIKAKNKFQWPKAKELLLFCSVFFLSIGIPEICVRIFWEPPSPQFIAGTRKFTKLLSQLALGSETGKKLYKDDPTLLWSLNPSKIYDSFNHHYHPNIGKKQPIRISINKNGHRGSPINKNKPAATLRILCLGDSNFFGYPLDDNDTFPSALNNALKQELPYMNIEVVNAGVPGYSSVQGAIWYKTKFQYIDFDWMLLSFLNNDAWPHPQSDKKLLEQYQNVPFWIIMLQKKLRILQFANTLLRKNQNKDEFKPRVPIDVFIEKYKYLIQSARKKGARVMLLDYRAAIYENYKPYSTALKKLANQSDVLYFSVSENAKKALKNWKQLERKYDCRWVKRRWGVFLEKRPYLYLYAEYYPEHLNEVGTVWLADLIAPSLIARPQ